MLFRLSLLWALLRVFGALPGRSRVTLLLFTVPPLCRFYRSAHFTVGPLITNRMTEDPKNVKSIISTATRTSPHK
ncbi:Protein of unknown function [Pyronema omphalodes CBS 100304]|uniref:Secreted protein n=1 Tax=Pyronema omphalodes (strain CBS 100304) TaxID=1076935 RepID=U4LVV3_PYROM|nr:Protein of unknown function [Pyronema omphalodes CBS 100304]